MLTVCKPPHGLALSDHLPSFHRSWPLSEVPAGSIQGQGSSQGKKTHLWSFPPGYVHQIPPGSWLPANYQRKPCLFSLGRV